jgi:hypothetical protein
MKHTDWLCLKSEGEVARFFNRQDAEDHVRFLNRFMPASEFEVLFDVPTDQLS